jgi:hypothetical protein
MKKLPIKIAKDISNKYNQSQVIILTFDKTTGLTHVVTYGKSKKDSVQAANGGNLIKEKILKWPAENCIAIPSRSSWKWIKTEEEFLYDDAKHDDIVWVEWEDEDGTIYKGFASLTQGTQCFYFDEPINKDCPKIFYYANNSDWSKNSTFVKVYKCKEIQ